MSSDDEIVAWYAEQRLSPEALARMTARPRRHAVRWVVLALAAGALVGLGVWATRPETVRTLDAVPLRYAEALPIPPKVIPLPPGMVRLDVPIHERAFLAEFLLPGTVVDVLVTAPGGKTETVCQAVYVLEPPTNTSVGLMMTPSQADAVRHAKGEIALTLRNDLDVSLPDSAVRSLLSAPNRPVVQALYRRPPPGSGSDVVRTVLDPVSTFALDVDTASYSYALSVLGSGWQPDPSSVRVEEFVNALPYDDPRPVDALFAARFEVVPSPWTEGYDVVRVGLRARDIPDDRRPPLHLTFLVDTSGSMEGQLWLVRQALWDLTRDLDGKDTVAVVTFADRAQVVLQPTFAHEPQVQAAVFALRTGGGTGLEEGLRTAYPLAASGLGIPGEHRVVLVTDGMANIGESDAAALTAQLREWTHAGIGLTALGVGRNGYRDELMEALADANDGNYAYIDSVAQAREVLSDELVETMLTLARDARVQITWDPDAVEGWRRIGYADRALADGDFRDDAVDAGEIGPGHHVTVLYEVRRIPGGSGPLGTLELRAEPAGAEGQPAIEQRFSIDGPVRASLAEASADTRMAVAAATLGLRLAGSPIVALDDGRIYALAEAAQRAEYPDDAELLTAIRDLAVAKPVPPSRPTKRCTPFEVIVSGGERETIFVDDEGIPCPVGPR